MNTFDMKDKIAKLLAKAEGTSNEAERDAFNAKATKLMVQLGIELADLESKGEAKAEDIVVVNRDFPGNYSIAWIPFVSSVARGFGNITVLQSKPYSASGLTRRAIIIGHETDVAMFVALLDSLVRQATTGLRVWQRQTREERRYFTDQQKYLGNRSFITAFGSRCGTRLAATRREEVSTASTGAALVLVDKKAKVDEYTQSVFAPKNGKGGIRNHGWDGYMAGSEAGNRADIGGNRVGTGKDGELAG